MQEAQVWSLGQEDPLEEGMAAHSRIFTCRNPWTEESGGLQSMRLYRVGHYWHSHFSLFKMSSKRSRMCMVNTCFFTVISLLSYMCVCVCVCVCVCSPPVAPLTWKRKVILFPLHCCPSTYFVPLGSGCAHIWGEGQFRCRNSFVY